MSESNSLSQSSLSSLASLSQNLGNDISRNSNESSSDESFDDAVDDQILVIIVEELVEINNNSWGGSKPGKSPNKQRDFEGQYARLVQQYFSGDNSVYNETKMVTSKSLLLVLAVNCLEAVDMLLLLLLLLLLFYEKKSMEKFRTRVQFSMSEELWHVQTYNQICHDRAKNIFLILRVQLKFVLKWRNLK